MAKDIQWAIAPWQHELTPSHNTTITVQKHLRYGAQICKSANEKTKEYREQRLLIGIPWRQLCGYLWMRCGQEIFWLGASAGGTKQTQHHVAGNWVSIGSWTTPLWSYSGHVQLLEYHPADAENAGGILYPIWFGNILGSPRRAGGHG